MKRFLGTVFLLLFLAGTVFTGLGCGGEKKSEDEGNASGVPTADQRQQEIDDVLGE